MYTYNSYCRKTGSRQNGESSLHANLTRYAVSIRMKTTLLCMKQYVYVYTFNKQKSILSYYLINFQHLILVD